MVECGVAVSTLPGGNYWQRLALSTARTAMNSAQKKWKTHRDDKLLHQIYCQLRNRYYREIRSAKEKAWKEFLADARNKDIYTAL